MSGWHLCKPPQSGKRPTLGFGSGYGIMAGEVEPHVGLCADSMKPAWDSLSLSLCHVPPLPPTHMLSLSQINELFFFLKNLHRLIYSEA